MAVVVSVHDQAGSVELAGLGIDRLVSFRDGFYRCLTRRSDALFELCDAVLTGAGRVDSLVELSQEKVFRRWHGALYDAVAAGRIDI